MRSAAMLLVGLAVSPINQAIAQAEAQELSENENRRHQIVIHGDLLAGSLSYARFVGDRWLVGGGAGIGFSILTLSAVGGDHFSEGRMIELVPVFLFVRYQSGGAFQMDVGIRRSATAHAAFGSFGGATFIGGYVAPFIGDRRVKIGFRVLAGRFSETQIPTEFGATISPTFRIVF